jgi:hypothetical protein
MTPSCKTCIHWQPVPADPMNLGAPRFGTCLRFPPVAYPINDRQSVNVRPQTVEGDRCGEYLMDDPTRYALGMEQMGNPAPVDC